MLAVSIVLIFAYVALSTLRKPVWTPPTVNWKKINLIVAVCSAIYSTFIFFLVKDFSILEQVGALSASASLAYITFQSLYTDPKYRKVDRRLFYLGYPIPIIANFLLFKEDDAFLTIWFIFMVASLALIFIPKLMGASDGRAFFFFVVALYPIMQYNGFLVVLGGMMLLSVCYAIYDAIRNKEDKGFFKKVVSIKSMPAVPMILLPALVYLPITLIF